VRIARTQAIDMDFSGAVPLSASAIFVPSFVGIHRADVFSRAGAPALQVLAACEFQILQCRGCSSI
jgi:hypothetical protein